MGSFHCEINLKMMTMKDNQQGGPPGLFKEFLHLHSNVNNHPGSRLLFMSKESVRFPNRSLLQQIPSCSKWDLNCFQMMMLPWMSEHQQLHVYSSEAPRSVIITNSDESYSSMLTLLFIIPRGRLMSSGSCKNVKQFGPGQAKKTSSLFPVYI